VEFNRDMGFQNIIIEGDALEVVNALQKGYCWSEYRQLIEDAKVILNSLQS
jgi:hypothetical protein